MTDRVPAEQTDVEEAVKWLAGVADLSGNPLSWSVAVVLAELDRQRARIAAVLAEVDAREQWAQPWQTAGLSCVEIRTLLEGEPAQSPPARCGVGFPIGPLVRGMWTCCLDPDHDGPHRSQQQVEREGR